MDDLGSSWNADRYKNMPVREEEVLSSNAVSCLQEMKTNSAIVVTLMELERELLLIFEGYRNGCSVIVYFPNFDTVTSALLKTK